MEISDPQRERINRAKSRLDDALQRAKAGEDSPDLLPAIEEFDESVNPFLIAADLIDPPPRARGGADH